LSFNSLSFDDGFDERPFRLAKFTACRKKCAFLSAQRHEVKASHAEKGKIACSDFAVYAGGINGDRCNGLQANMAGTPARHRPSSLASAKLKELNVLQHCPL